MKTSLTNSQRKVYSIEESLRMLKDAGFDGVDFQIFGEAQEALDRPDYLEFFEKIGNYAKEIGLEIAQTHSPYPSYVEEKSDEENEEIFRTIAKAVLASGKLGSKYVIVHPPVFPERKYDRLKEENREYGINFYKRLEPYAKEAGVKICIENMWNYDWNDWNDRHICPTTLSHAEELIDWCDTLGREHFAVCLDIGHALLYTENPAEMIRKLGDRLETLHVHDVDGQRDLHTAPYFGLIQWDEVCQALADINYQGVFNLESCVFVRDNFPNELFQDALTFQAKIARYLADDVEKRKQK